MTDDPMVDLMGKVLAQYMRQQGMSVDEAARAAGSSFGASPALDAAVQRIKDIQNQAFTVSDAAKGREYAQIDRWYTGPQDDDKNWLRFRERMIESGKGSLLPDLDALSTQVLALCADPSRGGLRRKGLVIGNVQSGKTANYTSVIAKAVDAGYRMIIVLAGIHNNLRKQTQERLDDDLFDSAWFTLTTSDADFGHMTSPPDAIMSGDVTMVAVVKKHATRLRRLSDWFASAPLPLRRNCATLLLDDEADQATPSSAAAVDAASAINREVRRLWKAIPTGTYLAYTATPFANIFMNPDDDEDLFPSDFIKTIPTGEDYFGAERIFGKAGVSDEDASSKGLDVVRDVPDTDVATLKPPSNSEARSAFQAELPDTLRDAVTWFVLATAIRRARGQRQHSSMLVHVTHYAGPHFSFQEVIKEFVESLSAQHEDGNLTTFRQAWDSEAYRAEEVRTVSMPSWEVVTDQLGDVLQDLEVIVDNGKSDDRLDYSGPNPATVIAVGGGTLSRGLTLEGLVVSYFTRTSNTYDTLMQMGRWFGYRSGYEDLPRIWAPSSLVSDYQFLAMVESELRSEINLLTHTGHSPAELGVRVRAHPGRLEITARNKMAHAKTARVSLSEQRRQTFIFDGADVQAIEANWAALEKLLSGHRLEPMAWGPRGRLWAPGIGGQHVAQFLKRFSFHKDQRLFDGELMARWITQMAPSAPWNLVVLGNSTKLAADGVTPLGSKMIGGRSVPMINRAAMPDSVKNKINIKALMSSSDRVADLDPKLLGKVKVGDEEEVRRARHEHGAGAGLVVAYPISAQSRRTPGSTSRLEKWPSDRDLLGLGLVFPKSTRADSSEGDFVSVRADWEVPSGDDEELPEDTEGETHEGRFAE